MRKGSSLFLISTHTLKIADLFELDQISRSVQSKDIYSVKVLGHEDFSPTVGSDESIARFSDCDELVPIASRSIFTK